MELLLFISGSFPCKSVRRRLLKGWPSFLLNKGGCVSWWYYSVAFRSFFKSHVCNEPMWWRKQNRWGLWDFIHETPFLSYFVIRCPSFRSETKEKTQRSFLKKQTNPLLKKRKLCFEAVFLFLGLYCYFLYVDVCVLFNRYL